MADVFVSYSRTDQRFVHLVHDELVRLGRDPWVDWEDIPPTARWLEEIFAAIDGSDAFLFVISKRSVASRVCAGELAHATDGGKRLIPVLREEVPRSELPVALAELQWIDARAATPVTVVAAQIARSLDTNLEWAKAHTRLLTRARDWDKHGRPRSRVLRCAELRDAENWLAPEPAHDEPKPTRLQLAFVEASRRAARQNTTVFAGVASIVAVVALALSVVAFRERDTARAESSVAQSRELAARATAQLEADPELAVLLATRAATISATPDAVLALRRSLRLDRLTGAVRTSATATPIALSPNGSVVLSAGAARTKAPYRALSLVDARTGATLYALGLHRLAEYPAASFTPNSKYVLLEGAGTSWVWDISDGRLIGTFGAPAWWFTQDGRKLAVEDEYGSVTVLDVATHTRLRTLGAVQPTDGFSSDGSGRLAVSTDTKGGVWEWNTTTVEPIVHYGAHVGHQLDIARLDRSGDVLATSSVDGNVYLWRQHAQKPFASLVPPRHAAVQAAAQITAMAFSPDGSYLAVGDTSGEARIWRIADGTLQAEARRVAGPINDLEYRTDGRRVVAASGDGAARVLDARSGAQLLTLHGHGGAVRHAWFDRAGAEIFTTGSDGVRRWSVSSARPTVLAGMNGDVSAQFDPTNSMIVASDFDTTWLFSDGGKLIKRLKGHEPNDGVISTVSSDGSHIASVASDGRILLYARQRAWKPVRLPVAGDGQADDVAFSTDGRRLLAIFSGRSDVFDVLDRRRLGFFRGYPVYYSADLSRAIVWRASGSILLALPSGRTLARLPDGGISAIAPDGDLAAITRGSEVLVWDTVAHRTRAVLHAPSPVESVVFDSTGLRILTTQSDDSAAVWSASSGHQTALIVNHAGRITGAALNADASLLALTVGSSIRVFDAATGVALGAFDPGSGELGSGLSFGGKEDAMILVGQGQIGTATVMACEICEPLPDLVRLARSRVTRGLSTEERERYLHDRS